MIKAVLLDLDGTLLHNPTRRFLEVYFSVINQYFEESSGKTGISDALTVAVKALMFGQRNMYLTNHALLLEQIENELNLTQDYVNETLNGFYKGPYRKIQSCTEAVDASPKLVELLRKKGYQIVIATNPIYPRNAIAQRLEWAGLSSDFSEYDFVTHADNMHFAKPNPAYYAEILAHIGVEPDEAIMIGNETNNDIIPANTLGMHTFLTSAESLHEILNDLSFLERVKPKTLHPDMIIPQLEGNVGALFGIIEDIPDEFWNQHPDPDEWSPLEIICHLCDKEENDQRPRLQRIMAEANPFLPHTPPPGPNDMQLCSENGQRAAHKFLESRIKTLKLIESIQEQQWALPARHSIFGPTTLLEMAHFTAQHDRLHLTQLCQTLGKCQ